MSSPEDFHSKLAEPHDLRMLAVSSQSKLCPILRHLTLHEFVLPDANSADAFAGICASRGLAPFSTPDCSAGSFQLDRIALYLPWDPGFLLLDTVRLSLSMTVLLIFTHPLSDILGLFL